MAMMATTATTTKMAVSMGLISSGAALVVGAVSLYTRGVVTATKSDPILLNVTKKGGFVDTYYCKQTIHGEAGSSGTGTYAPKTMITPSLLAKSMFCSSAFQTERLLLSMILVGKSFPSESEFDTMSIKPGTTTIGDVWTVQDLGEEDDDNNNSTYLLMQWAQGHTYLKANCLPRAGGANDDDNDTTELEFWFGSNLTPEATTSLLGRTLLPFHAWYSRILCQNVATTLVTYLETKPKARGLTT